MLPRGVSAAGRQGICCLGLGLGAAPTSCPAPVEAPSAAARGVNLSSGGGRSQEAWAALQICCVTCQKSLPLPLPTVT